MEERGVVRAKVTAGGCVPGLVVGEGELDEAVGGEGVYAGAGESHVAADNRGTGRDTGNVGGCDPGLTVGDGGTDKAVCGVDVDGATELRVKGREDGTAGGGDPGLTARKGGLDKTVCGIGVYKGVEECHGAADNRGTGRADGDDGGRDHGLAVGEVVHKGTGWGASVDGAVGGGCAEPSQAKYVGGGGRDAGQGINTDYASVDQGRAASWSEEGAGVFGQDDDNAGGRDYVSVDQGRAATWREEGAGGCGRDGDNVGGSDPGPVVGEGGLGEVVCGVSVDGVTNRRGIK